MKCGVTTYIWSADFTPETLAQIPDLKGWGFDGIEFPLFRPDGFPASAVRRALEARSLEATTALALVPGMSLIADDPGVRHRTIRHVADIIKAAAEAGSTLLVGPVYAPVGELPGRRRTAEEWKRAVDAYQQLGPTLAAHGMTLGIEPLNRFETNFLNIVADGVALCADVGHPNVGLLFDTFHANIEEKQVGEALRRAAPYLAHVHISENDRGTPGSGLVDWDSVFSAIRDLRYEKWLTIEGFGFSLGDLSVAAAIWRDIEVTPDAIARDGIDFVRRRLS